MSGYQNYSGGNGHYPSYPSSSTAAYAAAIPQYTQSQINAYYQQYHCLPPHPHHVVPDYYTSPVTISNAHDATSSSPEYASQYEAATTRVAEPNMLAPPPDEETLRQQRRSASTGGRSRSNSNTRAWTCVLEQCTSTANFTRLADLQRHQATVHASSMPEFPCTEPRCTRVADKGFTRRDHLVEHLRNFHHLPIPKRRPGERSAGLPPY